MYHLKNQKMRWKMKRYNPRKPDHEQGKSRHGPLFATESDSSESEQGKDPIICQLEERFRLIMNIYNPEKVNVYWDDISRVDAALLEVLLTLLQETWNAFVLHNSYLWRLHGEDVMMTIFELLINALGVIEKQSLQPVISMVVVRRFVVLVVETSQYTMRSPGDLTKRNISALYGLLHVFGQDSSLVDLAEQRAADLNDPEVYQFLQYARYSSS
jgi:hypothetical protein